MRVTSINLQSIAGLDLVRADGLSDVVVFAGPNGVGKTRLVRELINFFRDPRQRADISLTVEATSEAETKFWGKKLLDTRNANDADKLRVLLQRSQRRNRYRSTVLNFESDRTVARVKPFAFSFDLVDPYEEDVGWDLSYNYLRDRFQDVQHTLFKLVESQRRKIADKAVSLQAQGVSSMTLDFPNPLKPFNEAFSKLLAPKKLLDLDVKKQDLLYEFEGKELALETLSSGEREVVNIVFDFLLRNPSDCIVFFDEPELHLHPELSYKLLQTLSSIGKSNQFIFCTHSPEIITASIENSVVFITPKKTDKSNQALAVSRDDATHHALNLLGQSVGIISLGKKLLLIEGSEASLDKQTYGAILQNEYPDLVLVPVGGKSTIRSFQEVRESVLNKTIWGVEFFMLCDRDAVLEIGENAIKASLSDRLKVLPRYHLENYFLDENVIAAIFSEMDPDQSWLRNADSIKQKLAEIACQSVPWAVALKVSAVAREEIGNIDIMPKGVHSVKSIEELFDAMKKRVDDEQARLSFGLDTDKLEALTRSEFTRLMNFFSDGSGDWKRDIPGRIVLNRFASLAQINSGRLKTLYLRKAAAISPDSFSEIREIFRSFKQADQS